MSAEVGRGIRVVDHWEADLDAVGFSGRSGQVGLVFASVSSQPPGSFFWSIGSRSGATLSEATGDEASLLNALGDALPTADGRAV